MVYQWSSTRRRRILHVKRLLFRGNGISISYVQNVMAKYNGSTKLTYSDLSSDSASSILCIRLTEFNWGIKTTTCGISDHDRHRWWSCNKRIATIILLRNRTSIFQSIIWLSIQWLILEDICQSTTFLRCIQFPLILHPCYIVIR